MGAQKNALSTIGIDADVGVTEAEINAGCDAFIRHSASNHVYLQVYAILEAAARARPTPAAGAATEAVRTEREACATILDEMAAEQLTKSDAHERDIAKIVCDARWLALRHAAVAIRARTNARALNSDPSTKAETPGAS